MNRRDLRSQLINRYRIDLKVLFDLSVLKIAFLVILRWMVGLLRGASAVQPQRLFFSTHDRSLATLPKVRTLALEKNLWSQNSPKKKVNGTAARRTLWRFNLRRKTKCLYYTQITLASPTSYHTPLSAARTCFKHLALAQSAIGMGLRRMQALVLRQANHS